MNLYIIVASGIVLSVIFHFVGVYAKARNIVWVMLLVVWGFFIGFTVNEISPKGYAYIDTIKGKYLETDAKIQKAMPNILLYEMLDIKKNYDEHQKTSN